MALQQPNAQTRNPKLKRRAGTANAYEYLLGASQEDPYVEPQHKAKRAKLDAIYETQERTATTSQLEGEMESAQSEQIIPQKRTNEESQEVAEARKRVKRREERERQVQAARESAKLRGNDVQLTAEKDDELARQREMESKYLQAETTSKRKQKDRMEMSFAKEFNAVRHQPFSQTPCCTNVQPQAQNRAACLKATSSDQRRKG